MAFLRSLILGLRTGNSDAENQIRIQEKKPEDYIHAAVMYREESLILYQGGLTTKFEIVLDKDLSRAPHVTYSIIRADELDEAEVAFIQLKGKLPVLIECSPDRISRSLLQDICNVIKIHPSWNVAHIAAHLGLVDCFKHATVASQINEPCGITWVTPLHIAVRSQQLASVKALTSLDARLDIADCDGCNVFHYAADTSKEIVLALSSAAAISVINERNNQGQAPLHLACLADNPECVKELLRAGADVNAVGDDSDVHPGKDAEASSLPCAKEILDMYPKELHPADMKHGGTPLHWAKSPQCLEALVDLGCKLDSKNFQGNTALHVVVSRSKFPCVMILLSHGANANIVDSEGNTSLHLAAKTGELNIVQALLVFGADVNTLNNAGETARHLAATCLKAGPRRDVIVYTLHAVGAERCPLRVSGCNEYCCTEGTCNGIPPQDFPSTRHMKLYDELMGAAVIASLLSRETTVGNGRHQMGNSTTGDDDSTETDSPPPRHRCRLLCLDGGGIRGLVLIQMLSFLETVVGCPVLHCFDWICGTSTGGVLALALAIGKSVNECRQLYFRLKDRVFIGPRPYESEPLEKFLRQELGEETVMMDIKDIRVMVTGVMADRHPADLHLFRNYDSPSTILGDDLVKDSFQVPPAPSEQKVWRAGRASGAAPTYFRAFGSFLDGGLIASNPTLDAMTEIHQINQAYRATGQPDQVRNLEVVVSLGTGRAPVVPVTTIDVFRPDSIWGAAKMAMGVSALGQLIVDQATQTNGRVVDRAQAWCSMIGVPYFRLNPLLSDDVALDETDNKTLIKILWETAVYMHATRRELGQLAQILTPAESKS